jgi:hypothetical protein
VSLQQAVKVEQGSSLAQIQEATRLLAEARSLDEIKHIHAMAQAAEQYARAERLGREAEGYAREVRIRAARKAGVILREMADRGERITPQTTRDQVTRDNLIPTLNDLGVTKAQSARWQRIAVLPKPEFEVRLNDGWGETALARLGIKAPAPLRDLRNEHGKRNGWTQKQSLRGLQQAAVQLQGLAEALDGRLLGDWSRLYGVEEARPFFEVLEVSLSVVGARLKRVASERRESAKRNAG